MRHTIKATFGTILTRDMFLREWFDNLARIEMPYKDMRCVMIIHKHIKDKALPYCRKFARKFAEHEFIDSPFTVYDHVTETLSQEGFMKKRWSVAFNFNILYQYRKGDLFIVEDDVFPPEYAYTKLSSLARIPNVGAVSGLSYNWKQGKENQPLAWWFIKRRTLPHEMIQQIRKHIRDFDFYDYDLKVVEDGGVGVEEVHATCTGCVYINEICFKNYYATPEGDLRVGQDINLGWHITHKLKMRYLLDWDVRCEHWHIDETGNIKGRF